MTELLSIFSSIDDVVSELDILLEQADENSALENSSANKLQRLFRGWRTRVNIYEKNLAAREVERVFRGHAARLICHRMRKEKATSRELAQYQYYALQLQKSFRGYYSRKYRQNHHLRKKYLENVKCAGERVRQSMEAYADQIRQDEEDKEFRAKEDNFKELTENLHHLVSTNQIPGVYNPRTHLLEAPTVNDVPVESYLRGAVKDLLQTKGLTKKTGLVRDLNGTLKIPLKGMKNRLSLQASVPYDVLEKERIRETIRHKLAMEGKDHDFHCGGKTTIIDNKADPMCVDDPYMDGWSNPMMKRGIPKNQKAMIAQAHSRTTAVNFHPDPVIPFHQTVSGNKSVVLPNNLFDTIADAEENGGVTRRHVAKTARFGLTKNCDNRVLGGTLPVPPIKSATLLPTKRTIRAQRVKARVLSSTAPLMRPESNKQEMDPFADSSDDES
mmetsp:Transcript_97/g.207  ORF Transcript_97/g.207 Transcript_97/m.207 type:complete len:443 (+) Transcript_97:157-1485(+)